MKHIAIILLSFFCITSGCVQTVSASVNVSDYGAKCDGSTNDITAFNNASAEASLLNETLVIPGGTCILNSQWMLPNGLKVKGQGTFLSTISCAANIVCILATGLTGPQITDLNITAAVGSTGSNLQIGDTTHTVNYAVIRNVAFGVSGTALILTNVGTSYITNNWFNGGYSAAGISISSPLNIDGGDALIDGNWMIGTSTTIAIQHISGGGWKISNNKLVTNQYGYFMFASLDGETLSSLMITGNSIEGCVQACIAFANQSSVSGQLTNVVITGNQGGATSAGFFIDLGTNARSWIKNVSITGNTGLNISGNTCIFVDSTALFTVTGNTCNDNGIPTGFAYSFGATASIGSASGNNASGGFTAAKRWNITSGGDIRIDDVLGVPVANLPVNSNVGSRFVAIDGTVGSVPCMGGSTGTLAIRTAGGYKCF